MTPTVIPTVAFSNSFRLVDMISVVFVFVFVDVLMC